MSSSGRCGAAVVFVTAALVACQPPTEIPLPDSGDNDLCPAGYIYIPEGAFEMGLDFNDPLYDTGIQLFWDMAPRRTVNLSAYCIQKTEVTVAAFKACRKAGKCTAEIRGRDVYVSCNYSEEHTDRDNHPVNCVSWQAAREYCQQWEGGDLPSDAQWEKAARGTDRRLFPWGNEGVSCDRANFDSNGPPNGEGGGIGAGCHHAIDPATWEVGTIPSAGDSPYGLKDMSGNVAELVLDCYNTDLVSTCREGPCVDPVHTCDSGPYATRGGSAEDFVTRILSVVAHSSPDSLSPEVGFRCAHAPRTNGRAARTTR